METSSCDNILEILFSSPLFWKSRKVCIFLIQCHEHIHEKWDDKTKEFMDKLNKLALEWEVWPPDQTWEHSINKHDPVAFEQDECQLAENTETTEDDVIELISHFKALTTFFKKGGTSRNRPIPVDTNKFTDLLGVIRNKFAHRFLFNDSDKKLLNWFDAHAADNWIFQLQKFADYWIIRFPRLLPFTWEQYKYLDDFSSQNLADVYPNPLRKYYTDNSDNLFKAVEDFPMQLFKALKYHLQEEGCIETRFTLEGSDNQVLLEFRTLHKILVDVILDKSFSVEIAVSDESVTCEWYDLIDGSCSLTDKRNTPIKYADLPHWFRFSGYIVICNKISDIYNFANIYFKKLPEKIFSKIIIFTKADFTNLFYITEIYESYRENVVSNL